MKKKLTDRAWWIAGFVSILSWMLWFSTADEFIREESNGVAVLPFEVRENLKLARSWEPFARGSLRLVCTSNAEMRVVIQKQLEGMEGRRPFFFEIPALLVVDRRFDDGLEFKRASLTAMGTVDTIVTEPLTSVQLSKLIEWLDDRLLKRFIFVALEQNSTMLGFTDGRAVASMVARCAPL